MSKTENNNHYSEQTGHRLRGVFARVQRALEVDEENPYEERNHQLVYTDLEMTQQFPEVFSHTNGLGEALIVPGVNYVPHEDAEGNSYLIGHKVVQEIRLGDWTPAQPLEVDAENPFEERNHRLVYDTDLSKDEVRQLEARGVIFPMETAEPMRATFFKENGDVLYRATGGVSLDPHWQGEPE